MPEEEALVSVSSGDTAASGKFLSESSPLGDGDGPRKGLVAGPVAAGARLRSRGALCGFLRQKKKKSVK